MSSKLRPVLLLVVSMLAACGGPGVYQVELLPAPDIIADKLVNPFPAEDPRSGAPYQGILYATDRLPAARNYFTPEAKTEEVYYENRRGHLLRLGMGSIQLDRKLLAGKQRLSWEEIRKLSIERDRDTVVPIQVRDIQEFGILDRTYTIFTPPAELAKKTDKPGKQYANLINRKLAISKRKDIYIYVHGYNTGFEDPLLVGAELWHYMGYEGVFIAYSWPATPRGLAYLADMDTARLASRNLRLFLEYLSEATTAENIHIIGYSMGSRVVTYALQDISLINKGRTHEQIRAKIHIGHVVLIGSDLERGVFAGFMMDGFMNVPKTFTVYMSDTDKALFASRWLFERRRLGETWGEEKPVEEFIKYLRDHPGMRLIDVTHAKGAGTGNGHHYFIQSPWVSGDLLLTLMHDLQPEQRGLVRDSSNMWSFTREHPERIRGELAKLNPALLDVTLPQPVR